MYHLIYIVAVGIVLPRIEGHGRIIDPPGRSNAWRHGFKTPPNYNDMGLNCGGFADQWNKYGGKCGVCGDPWNAPTPRENEFGGKYGVGVIVKSYMPGEKIRIKVDLTANHKGYFEFRLCPDPKGVATHECLNRYLLQTDQGATRWKVPNDLNMIYEISLQLPQGLTCNRCVLQWLYNAGNSHGCDKDGCGIGFGPQEQFINCADISIGKTNSVSPRPTPPTPTPTTPTPTSSWISSTSTAKTSSTTRWTESTFTTKAETTRVVRPPTSSCRPHPIQNNLNPHVNLNLWCSQNCRPNYCPAYCICS